MMAILQRRIAEVAGQIAELRQQVIEAAVGDRVVAPRRGGHRREADFPEAKLLGEMAVDLADVERLLRQGDARADRARDAAPAAP